MPAHARQLLASLLVAAAIVVIAIVVVTAQLGPNAGDDERSSHERGGEHRRVER
ncbi:MAG: hypothetical protein WBC33_04810 [Conexibacter sp.]